MKTLHQYIAALFIATMSACASVPAFAGDTHNIKYQGEDYTIVVSNSSPQLTAKVLASTKKKLETVLVDAQSARYHLSEKGDLMFDVQQGGKTLFVLHYGFSINGKNRLGGYVGYVPMCIVSTDDGDVARVAIGMEEPEMIVCMDFMHAVAEDI